MDLIAVSLFIACTLMVLIGAIFAGSTDYHFPLDTDDTYVRTENGRIEEFFYKGDWIPENEWPIALDEIRATYPWYKYKPRYLR